MADEEHFRFADLPAEMQMKIYEYTFESYLVKVWPLSDFLTLMNGYSAPAILLTNRQIYNEAIKTFYRTAVFTFSGAQIGIGWFRGLPHEFRNEVKKIVFTHVHPYVKERTAMRSLTALGDWVKEDLEDLLDGDIELRKGILQIRGRLKSGHTLVVEV